MNQSDVRINLAYLQNLREPVTPEIKPVETESLATQSPKPTEVKSDGPVPTQLSTSDEQTSTTEESPKTVDQPIALNKTQL